jgi:hypothetical protein
MGPKDRTHRQELTSVFRTSAHWDFGFRAHANQTGARNGKNQIAFGVAAILPEMA